MTSTMTDKSITNIEEKHCKNARLVFYKKPIKKDNYKLEVDYDSPQELRRQRLLEIQKR